MSGGVLALTVAECLEQLMERGWAEASHIWKTNQIVTSHSFLDTKSGPSWAIFVHNGKFAQQIGTITEPRAGNGASGTTFTQRSATLLPYLTYNWHANPNQICIFSASTHLVNDLPSAQLCAALERLCAKPIARLNEVCKFELNGRKRNLIAYTVHFTS
jgi:hypothetical protein